MFRFSFISIWNPPSSSDVVVLVLLSFTAFIVASDIVRGCVSFTQNVPVNKNFEKNHCNMKGGREVEIALQSFS